MKGIKHLILLILLLFSSTNTSQAVNPKTSTIIFNSIYGTVGGALLGVASLAFGGRGKYVAKGASIGLYAGLAFGVYVVASHSYLSKMNMEGDEMPQDKEMGRSFFDFDGGGGGGEPQRRDERDRFEPQFQYRYFSPSSSIHPLRRSLSTPIFYLNLFHYQF